MKRKAQHEEQGVIFRKTYIVGNWDEGATATGNGVIYAPNLFCYEG